MAGVLIVGETGPGGLSRSTLQVAAAARQLAEAAGESLLGALIGTDLSSAAQAFQCGLETLYVADAAHLRPYTAAAYVEAARAIVEQSGASIVLCVHGADTREWVPQLAARMDAGLVMDCTGLRIEHGAVVVMKPVNGGSVTAELAVRGRPAIVTVRASAFEALSVAGEPERVAVRVMAPEAPRVTVLGEESAESSDGPRLKDARIVVSGGRGVGGAANWHFIEEASAALGAAIGCSRPVADSGWVPSSHQVG
jgi:electron transfer flavoprotein alpha subunit